MPFPVIKLVYLAIRQLSKPMAATIKHRAKVSPFLRNKIVLPLGQAYHKFEIRGRLRLIGIGKKDSKVTPLTEENAAELGADILGELIIYSVASLTIFLEYYRQSKQKAEHEETQEDRLDQLRKHVLELEAAGDRQRAEISSLTREIHDKLDKMSEELQIVKEQSPAKGPAKVAGLDSRALILFFGMFSGALIFIMNTS